MNRPLSQQDFELIRDYLRRTAGLEFDEARRHGLAAIVSTRLAATGVSGVPEYVAALDATSGSVERQRLLDAVTIQETHFHRARPQIEALRDHILPDIIRRAADEGREVVVWSAGCSTGEEPFTLAMLMLEVAAALPPWLARPAMRVVGSDVSSAALQVATSATYSGRTIDLAEPEAVKRWLQLEPDGTYVVRDEVRALVTFVHNNLIADAPPFRAASIDLIVCRHVTIYFARETTRALVGRFQTALAPEGWLLMGPAESLWQVSDAFTLEAVGEAFAYRSAADRPVERPGPRPAERTSLGGRPGDRSADRPGPSARLKSTGAAARGILPRRLGVPLTPQSRTAPPPGSQPPASGLRSAEPPRAPASRAVAGLGTPFERAQAEFDLGRYDRAAQQCQAIVDADPVHPAAYVLLGHALLNEGDAPGAVGPLQKAVFLDPQAGHAHFLLAVALSSCGRAAQAGPSYRAAAATLAGVPAETVRRLLDGRKMSELVQLCRRLADAAEGAAQDQAEADGTRPVPAPAGRGL